MAKETGRSNLVLPPEMDEEGHYFDFISFYSKVEFCDRSIRLEILEESTKDLRQDAASQSDGSSMPGPLVPLSNGEAEVEELPINSIVVAAKSRVLKTMFSSGMRESDKGSLVVLKVTREEKAAFKEMLHFFYAGSLSPQLNEPTASVRELVDLLVVGDKFEVPSFMGAVLEALNRTDLTIPNNVVIALEIPEALQNRPQIKKFVDEARAHIVNSFKDVTATWETPEFMGLSMGAVQLLLQSEELEADSEEEIFDKLLG